MTSALGQLFAPCTADAFLLEYFGVKFLHSSGPAGRFSDLLAPDARRSEALAQELQHTLEAPVRQRRSSAAIEACRAKHDLVVLQLAGGARWRIFDDATELDAPAWESDLQDGDALYIPGGRLFAADDGGERLEISIQSPTAADLVLWAANAVRDIEAFQTPIPRFAAPATRAAYMGLVRSNLRQFLRRPALLEYFQTHLHDSLQSPDGLENSSIPELTDDRVIVLTASRRPRIEETSAATIALNINGQRFAFDLDAASLIYYIVDHAPVSVGEFVRAFKEEFDRDELLDFLGAVFSKGVVVFRTAEEQTR